jgi:hypothetical protein
MNSKTLANSISNCRNWLGRRAPFRASSSRRPSASFFRPQLLALEDRCLLSTAGATVLETFQVTRPATGRSIAHLVESEISGTADRPAGVDVVVMLPGYSQAMRGVAVSGTLSSSSNAGEYQLFVTVPSAAAGGGAIMQPAGTDFIVVFATATLSPATTPADWNLGQHGLTAQLVVILSPNWAPSQAAMVAFATYVENVSSGFIALNFSTSADTTPAKPVQPPIGASGVPPVTPPPVVRPPQGGPPAPIPESVRAIPWWSQTAHPGPGPVVVLAIPYGSLSSLPSAQGATPVVLFISSPSAHLAENKPAQVSGVTVLPGLIEQLIALELLSSRWQTPQRNESLLAVGPAPVEAVGDGLDASEQQSPLEAGEMGDEFATQQCRPPSRAQLLAMTEKIMQGNQPVSDGADASPRAISIRAVIACAAVQTVWLTLRQFATSRAPSTRFDRIQLKNGDWKNSK